jgi:hypothetical protein
VQADEFAQGGLELGLAAEDDVHLLQVRGEAQAVQLRARGDGAADVPGVGGAADGAVHEVQGVGYGVEHHPRAAEHAGALADRAGQARAVAGHGEGLFADAVDLAFSFFEYVLAHGVLLGEAVSGLLLSRLSCPRSRTG